MEMIGGSFASYLARTPCVPLFSTLFNRVGNRRAFRLPGEGGHHFHCTVEPSPGVDLLILGHICPVQLQILRKLRLAEKIVCRKLPTCVPGDSGKLCKNLCVCVSQVRKNSLKIEFLGRIFLGHPGPRRRDIPDKNFM